MRIWVIQKIYVVESERMLIAIHWAARWASGKKELAAGESRERQETQGQGEPAGNKQILGQARVNR